MPTVRLLFSLALGALLSLQTALAAPPTPSQASPVTPTPSRPADPLHAWVGLNDGSSLDNWVQWHIAEERRLVAQLLAVSGPRTTANTLALYDQAQFELTLAGNETYILFSTSSEKPVRDKAQALLQVLSAEGTSLSLNQGVYNALTALDLSAANPATRYYKDRTLLEYRLAGVDKDAATRAHLHQLLDRATDLSLKFSRVVNDDVRKVPVHAAAELDGLPADYIAHHKPSADGTITLTTDSPDMTPVMSYAKDPALRRAMYVAYQNRGYPANTQNLRDLLDVRQQIASTLAFPHWADLATADMMIGSAANMKTFLNQVDEASRSRAQREFNLLQTFVHQQDPAVTAISTADASYWNEQYRRAKFDFDSQSVRPYFPYEAVEGGILATAARLFHVEFRRVPDAPVWDPAVHAYDVLDAGQKAGRIYLDMHPRPGKDKWFSESSLIPGQLGKQLPEAALICNFPGGTPGDPGLMQYGDVVTFFHEFGHMMHEVLGGKQQWAGQSGITMERDFVEAPSQMLEEMFHDPAILQSFARNYKTGEVLPTAVIDRMNRASYVGRAGWVQSQLFYSTYSLQVHDEDPAAVHFDTLWEQDQAHFSPYQPVNDVHPYAAFTHLVGYTSNYYTYVLDKVIAVDFYAQFDPKNVLDGPSALRYRKAVLEPGSSKPAAELVQDFLGRPQKIDALEHWMDREFEPAPQSFHSTQPLPTPAASPSRTPAP